MKAAFVDFAFEDRDAIQLAGWEFEIHPPLRTAEELMMAASEAEALRCATSSAR